MNRRDFLTICGGVTVGSLSGCLTGRPPGEDDDKPPSRKKWIENAAGDSEIVDQTDRDTITVIVGAKTSKGPFGFAPVAVRITPGTKVQFKWSGEGAYHNVIDEGGAFHTDLYIDKGIHFSYTFETPGDYLYFCEPHKAAYNMQGAIIVEE